MAPTPSSADAGRRLAVAVEAVRRGDGVVSVVARVQGEAKARVSVEPDAQHYSASVMKLPILVAAHRLAERGLLDLSRPVLVHDDFASRKPGQRFVMDQGEDSDPDTWAARGAEVALEVLTHRMITVSGNLATNLVLDEVGTDEVAAVLAAAGCSPRTTIVRGIEDYGRAARRSRRRQQDRLGGRGEPRRGAGPGTRAAGGRARRTGECARNA